MLSIRFHYNPVALNQPFIFIWRKALFYVTKLWSIHVTELWPSTWTKVVLSYLLNLIQQRHPRTGLRNWSITTMQLTIQSCNHVNSSDITTFRWSGIFYITLTLFFLFPIMKSKIRGKIFNSADEAVMKPKMTLIFESLHKYVVCNDSCFKMLSLSRSLILLYTSK